jgi:hypothetical protein
LALEINPRAAAITELVLWISHLQWHFRTRGHTMPAEPVLKKFKNIECRDAVLAVEVELESKPGEQRAGKLAWPKTLSERVKAVRTALATVKDPGTAPEMAKRFARARAGEVGEILETLCAVGKARRGKGAGTYLP